MLYLDYAASAPVRPGALKVLEKSMIEDFANPSSAHVLGRNLQKRIEDCRRSFLNFLDAHPRDYFVFTGSATESNNMVIEGVDLKQGDAVIVSSADHPSVTAPMERLRKRNIEIKECPLLQDGSIDEQAFFNSFSLHGENVKLVILSHVNNQSGTVSDVCRLSREIKRINSEIHIHIDAAQGFGKIPVSLKSRHIDSMSISSHKIGGPKGIAGLYIRAGVKLLPLMYGGGQENGYRSSTQAAPLIYSFCEAARESMKTIEASLGHVRLISNKTQKLLKEKIDMVEFPFIAHSSPYILTFLLPGISSDIILRHLEQRGIMISSSSACSSRMKGANPVFTALHIPHKNHKFVLRVSFSYQTTKADAETFCNILAGIYNDLKIYIMV